MDLVLQWVKNIAIYLVLISVILNMLPNNNYKKYVKLFTGLLLALLIAKPLLQLLDLDHIMKNYYQYYGELTKQSGQQLSLEGVETEQRQAILEAYRAQILEELEQEASAAGWTVREAVVSLEEQEEEQFGQVRAIHLSLEQKEADEDILVAPVVIGSDSAVSVKEDTIERLKSKIAQRYQLDEKSVQIQ